MFLSLLFLLFLSSFFFSFSLPFSLPPSLSLSLPSAPHIRSAALLTAPLQLYPARSLRPVCRSSSASSTPSPSPACAGPFLVSKSTRTACRRGRGPRWGGGACWGGPSPRATLGAAPAARERHDPRPSLSSRSACSACSLALAAAATLCHATPKKRSREHARRLRSAVKEKEKCGIVCASGEQPSAAVHEREAGSPFKGA